MNTIFLLALALGITSFIVGFQITKLPQPDSSIIKAGELLEQAEAAYGEESQEITPFLFELGQRIITHQKNYHVAMEYLERACAIRSRRGNPESLEMVMALQRTGECALFKGDAALAEERIGKALAIRRSLLGDDHPMTGQCWAAKAMAEILKANPGTQPKMLRSLLSVNPAPPSALPPAAREAAQKTITCMDKARAEIYGAPAQPETVFNYEAAWNAFSICDPFYDEYSNSLKALKERPSIQGLSGQKCFIATAVYGSPDCSQVVSLRRFRDKSLLPTAIGRAFVSAYQAVGPLAARAVENRPFPKKMIRVLLDRVADYLDRRGI